MKIGFGSSKITPSSNIVIAGNIPARYTGKVHDDILASAMVIESKNEKTVWISCDICHPNKRLTDEVVLAINKVIPDFSGDRLIINATHATAGFYLTDDEFLNAGLQIDFDKIMPLYRARQEICDGIVTAVKKALDTMCECTMELATADILTGFCRRVVYKGNRAVMYGFGPKEDFVRLEYPDGAASQMLYFYSKDTHTLKGVFANVPCPAQADELADYITADYWGVVRDKVHKELGQDVVIITTCRAAGELSPHRIIYSAGLSKDDEWGREAAERVGENIADSIIKESRRPIKKYSECDLTYKIKTEILDFPIRKGSEQERLEMIEYFKNAQNFEADGKAKDPMQLMKHAHIKRLFEDSRDFYKAKVSVVKIADVLIFTAPAELYCEYSRKISTQFPNNPMFDVQLTDDSLGYLPTKEAIERGGYSTDIFSCLTTAEGGEIYVEETKKLLREIMN